MTDQLKSRKKGVIKYAENPFLQNLVPAEGRRFVRRSGGKMLTIDDETGEVSDVSVAEIRQVEIVDSERFVKVYTDEIGRFFNLKRSTQMILEVLLKEIQKHKDTDIVYLDYALAKRYFTKDENTKIMSQPTFIRAVKELIENEFIAESTYVNQYFINPRLFFNGDRLKLVREYRRKKSPQQDEQLQLDGLNPP